MGAQREDKRDVADEKLMEFETQGYKECQEVELRVGRMTWAASGRCFSKERSGSKHGNTNQCMISRWLPESGTNQALEVE